MRKQSKRPRKLRKSEKKRRLSGKVRNQQAAAEAARISHLASQLSPEKVKELKKGPSQTPARRSQRRKSTAK